MTSQPPRRASKTAMIAAVKAWDVAEVERIADARPELVGFSDKRGRTPLHLCCAVAPPERKRRTDPHGIETADLLLARGADLHAVERIPDGDAVFPATPLWYAVARGANLPLVRHLLRLGANADHCLWAVVWRDDAAMCRALLAARPQIDLVFDGETPVFYAARLKRLKTLALLLEAGADCTIPGPDGVSIVEIAKRRKLPAAVIARLDAAAG